MANICLLNFQALTPARLPDLLPYLRGKRAVACDYSLLYFHMWNGYLRTEFAIDGDVLFLRRNTRHGIFYYPPLLRDCDDLLAGLALLSRVSDEEAVRVCALPEQLLERAEQTVTVLAKQASRRWADYIYAAEDLSTLRGHRYNKKRNLVHQFERLYPDHSYEELSAENLDEARALLVRMMAESEQTEDERYENERVLDVLRDYLSLPLCGGLARVRGEAVAFSIGELMDDTLVVHIEKADRRFKGGYQFINQRFAQAQLAKTPFALVNREDDTGDEGLRQAKLSYFPVQILHKYQLLVQNNKKGETV